MRLGLTIVAVANVAGALKGNVCGDCSPVTVNSDSDSRGECLRTPTAVETRRYQLGTPTNRNTGSSPTVIWEATTQIKRRER